MKAISLFSGVGGFDLGFERAGIETVLQAERDPHCLKVLERHWPQVRRVNDVRCVGDRTHSDQHLCQDGGQRALGRLQPDLIVGGFPCQDLSVAGKRAGLGGERSGLWFEFHRVLSELRPRWTVIENVPGLLSSNNGRDFAILLMGLEELGYGWAYRVLDARYARVPQRRRRVFIVGCLGDRLSARQVLSVCESCGGNPPPSRTSGEGVAYALTAGVRGTGDGHGNAWNSNYVADTLREHPRPGSNSLGAIAIRTANTGANGHGIAEDVAYTLDGAQVQAVIASALSASMGHHGHSSPRGDGADNLIPVIAGAIQAETFHHGGYPNQTMNSDNGHVFPAGAGVRRLTPRECERLQGFPDDWTAGQADSHRYRQMGNAVCVPVAEWIGHRIVAMSKVVAA